MTCCLDCSKSAMRDAKDQKRDEALQGMALRGFINCTTSPGRASFYPMEHVCEGHKPATEEVVAKRTRWLEQKRAA